MLESVMTPLEKDCYEVLIMVREKYALGQPRHQIPSEIVMGHVARMIERLNNNRFGCATGEHRSDCTCKPAVKGQSIKVLLMKKAEARKTGRSHGW
jgi:hypothetical protein